MENLQKFIAPFPTTSAIAARYFRDLGIKSDLIYIDGSHDYDDVLADLQDYYKLLSSKGWMFGHDVSFIRKALEKFVEITP